MTQRNPIGMQGIDHVVIRARDMARMIAFYRDVLGCPIERESEKYSLVQLRAGASLIDLVDADGLLGRQRGAPPDGAAPNMDHVCLAIDGWDIAAITAYLERHGVAMDEPGERYGAQGMGPSLYIKDPEGNTVELKGPPAQPAGK